MIKFSSWAINRLSLLKEAFPEVPWVWIYRDPAAVLASVLAGPPGWMQLRFQPRLAESLLGITNLSCAASPQSFATQALANFSAAALAGTDGAQPFVNYRSLPEAIWQTVAPTFHMDLDADDVIAMKAEASWSAHEVSRTPFVPGARPSGSLPAPSPLLEGLYQEMEAHAKKRHDHSRI